MLRRYSVNFALFSILLDSISIILGLSLTYFSHPWLEMIIPFLSRVGGDGLSFPFATSFVVIWIFLNLELSLYDGRRNVLFVVEISRLFLCILVAVFCLAGLLFFAYPKFVHSSFASIILVASFFMGLWRAAVRYYWRYQYSHNNELRRVLIVGARGAGRRVAEKFSAQHNPNLQMIGFLDDDYVKSAQNQDILGSIGDLEKVVSSHGINIIVIAIPSDAFSLTRNIVDRLCMTPVKIWIVPEANQLARYHSEVVYLADIPLLDIRAPSISDKQRLIKRLFDLIFAFTVILIFAPVMLIIAIFIKLDSPGPIIFRQKRIGENMQPFNIMKFRTMIQDAEALSSHVEMKDEHGMILHKHREDPRVTELGRFLRHYSLDEFPQFINVLLGNMSIVGPRPEMPHLVEKYKSWQFVRFTVPQGITGWWQVTGRSEKPMHLNTDKDLFYIDNYSFWLDLKIIIKTIIVVIRGRGAF
jgi:exopolysaccharide biosynthesis polyprenyl glycosylphosphotransferase